MNCSPIIRNDLTLGSPAGCCMSASPEMLQQQEDRSIFSNTESSSERSVVIDCYTSLDFSSPKKRQWKDDSIQAEQTRPAQSSFPETPKRTSGRQSDHHGLRLRAKPFRTGKNFFNLQTGYTAPAEDYRNDDGITVGNDIVTACTSTCFDAKLDEDCLATPRGTWDPSPCTPRLLESAPLDFYDVSPSQPNLPFLPCF